VAAGLKKQVAAACLPAVEAPGGIFLELANPGRGRKTLTLPVGVTGLSAGGVMLKAEDASEKFAALNLTGQEAVIRLPHFPEEDLGQIRGRVLWARPEEGKAGEYAIALELADPELRVRKVLEDRLQAYPGDIKELWDQWDRVHARRLLPSADQAVYLVGVGAIGGGTALYFLGPEFLKMFGSILAIYGCLMMAARSAWVMWQERTLSED